MRERNGENHPLAACSSKIVVDRAIETAPTMKTAVITHMKATSAMTVTQARPVKDIGRDATNIDATFRSPF